MKKILKYGLIFLLGILVAILYFRKEKSNHKREQIQVLLTEIKNVSKLVVTESTFSEMYNYTDADKYFFETISFDKKIILSVNAKVQVSYDLSKMVIETDTINKIIIIKSLPKEEIFIAPNITYFDLEQSTFNQFTKEELNELNKKSIEKIKQIIDASTLKEQSKNQLIEELRKIYKMATLLDWKLIDETEHKLIFNTFKN